MISDATQLSSSSWSSGVICFTGVRRSVFSGLHSTMCFAAFLNVPILSCELRFPKIDVPHDPVLFRGLSVLVTSTPNSFLSFIIPFFSGEIVLSFLMNRFSVVLWVLRSELVIFTWLSSLLRSRFEFYRNLWWLIWFVFISISKMSSFLVVVSGGMTGFSDKFKSLCVMAFLLKLSSTEMFWFLRSVIGWAETTSPLPMLNRIPF